MKKLTVILSILFVVGLAHQTIVLAEADKAAGPVKYNFSAKKKHAGTTTAPVVTPSPAPSASPTA